MKISKLNYYILIAVIAIPFVFNWIGLHGFLSSPLSITITAGLLTVMLLLNMHRKMRVDDFIPFLILVATLTLTAILYHSLGTVLTCYNIFVMAYLFNNIQFEKRKFASYSGYFLYCWASSS